MFCTKCGVKLPGDASSCSICGAELKTDNTKNSSVKKVYHYMMLLCYGIALVVCFICNLAVNHTLSWFFIVLASVGLAFSVTNLPFLLKKYRILVSSIFVTLFLYLLLYVCCLYTDGDWLFSIAYPIATFSIGFVWLIIITASYLRINRAYQISIILFLTGIFMSTINPFINYWTDGKSNSFFTYLTQADNIIHICTAISLLVCSAVSAIIGTILIFRERSSK